MVRDGLGCNIHILDFWFDGSRFSTESICGSIIDTQPLHKEVLPLHVSYEWSRT